MIQSPNFRYKLYIFSSLWKVTKLSWSDAYHKPILWLKGTSHWTFESSERPLLGFTASAFSPVFQEHPINLFYVVVIIWDFLLNLFSTLVFLERSNIFTSFSFSDTWGDSFPISDPDWDLVIASDILLCKLLSFSCLFEIFSRI